MDRLQMVDRQVPVTPPPASGHSRPGWACPPPAVLGAYFDGEIDAASRQQLERHLADCEVCLEQVGLLARAAITPVAPVPAPLLAKAAAVDSRSSRATIVGWAAAAVIVVAGGFLLTQQAARPAIVAPATNAVRGVDATEVVVIEPGDGAVLSRESGVVGWEPVSRALFYEVRLTDVDGALWWETRTEATSVTIPAGALRPSAHGYIWITAHLPDNRSVRSPARAISIAAR
jgi:hypothetical protein